MSISSVDIFQKLLQIKKIPSSYRFSKLTFSEQQQTMTQFRFPTEVWLNFLEDFLII